MMVGWLISVIKIMSGWLASVLEIVAGSIICALEMMIGWLIGVIKMMIGWLIEHCGKIMLLNSFCLWGSVLFVIRGKLWRAIESIVCFIANLARTKIVFVTFRWWRWMKMIQHHPVEFLWNSFSWNWLSIWDCRSSTTDWEMSECL